MPTVFWTGKLTKSMILLVNFSNVIAWLSGNAKNTVAMKERVKLGYNGAFSDHVEKYDKLGLELQLRSARMQLDEIDFRRKKVLDVGCGTGVSSFIALEKGASKVVCGDISQFMLDKAKENAVAAGYGKDQIVFRQLDAEALPFEKDTFDVSMTGMTLGLLPDQGKAVAEMARVTRPDGLVSVGAHGPEHYWEAIDASLRAITKRYVFGYRLEWWPRQDFEVEKMFIQAGLTNTRTFRAVWRNDFPSGGQAYDFFAAVSASYWYANFPSDKIAEDSEKTRGFFERKGVTRITDDVIFAYGIKPN
ncbi:MAG TPA: class I SAM-dependent methyltransferase [Caldithrix sp.]|nr:class I SAM-dependent methyltransferase [Caldithrix sp.]